MHRCQNWRTLVEKKERDVASWAAWGELSPGSRPSSRHIPMLDTAAWKISVGQQKYLSHCWWWWWGRVQQLKLGNHNPTVRQCSVVCGISRMLGDEELKKQSYLNQPPLHFTSDELTNHIPMFGHWNSFCLLSEPLKLYTLYHNIRSLLFDMI